jgi:hypothetical protein
MYAYSSPDVITVITSRRHVARMGKMGSGSENVVEIITKINGFLWFFISHYYNSLYKL